MSKTFKIHIGNLSAFTEEADVLPLFEKYGKVIECVVHEHYGFLHMENEESGMAVIKHLNNHLVNGRHMKLTKASNTSGPHQIKKKITSGSQVADKGGGQLTKVFYNNLQSKSEQSEPEVLDGVKELCSLLKNREAVADTVEESPSQSSTVDKEVSVNEEFNGAQQPTRKEKRTKKIDEQLNFVKGIESNNYVQVYRSLCNGAKVEGCSEKIRFPIHFAVKNGFHDVLRVLLNEIIDNVAVNSVDEHDMTPFQVAMQAGDLMSCMLLLQNGACYDVSDRDPDSKDVCQLLGEIRKAFKLASDGENLEMEDILLRAAKKNTLKGLISCTNRRDETLMITAYVNGHYDICRLIVRIETNVGTDIPGI